MSTIESIVPGGVGGFGGGPFQSIQTPIQESAVEGSKSAYSLDGDTWVDLPVGPQFNLEITSEDNDIVLETDAGYRRTYRQYRRTIWKLSFKIEQADLSFFSDLHQLVRGATIPFYLTLDRTADPIVAIYGKKLAGMVATGTGDRAIPPILIYELTIRSES